MMNRTGFRLTYQFPQKFNGYFPPPYSTQPVVIVNCEFIQRYNDDGTITRIIKPDAPMPYTAQEVLERAEKFLPDSWRGQPIEVHAAFTDSK